MYDFKQKIPVPNNVKTIQQILEQQFAVCLVFCCQWYFWNLKTDMTLPYSTLFQIVVAQE